MKKGMILLFFFVAAFIFGQEKAAPKLHIDEQFYDFGNVKEGEIVEHDFTVKNTGTGELKITKVRASCGCTAAAPKKNVLKPGESTIVHVSFNTSRRSGAQHKYVYIMSNDPKGPQRRIKFIANILTEDAIKSLPNAPVLEFKTSQYNFGKVNEGETVTGKIEFMNKGKSELKIVKLTPSCDCVKAEVSKSFLNPGEKAEITFEFDTTGRVGKMTRTVLVESNDPANVKQLVTLFINIVGKK
jgi:ribosomal protein L30E